MSTTLKTIRPLTLLISAIVVAVACSLWTADSATTPASGRAAWEHLVLEREGNVVATDRELAEKINRLGGEGWEMFAVTPVQQDGTTKRLQFYFKRLKS